MLAAGLVALVALNRRVADERAEAVEARNDAEAKSQQLHDNLLESYEAQARQYALAGAYPFALAYLDEATKLGAHGPAHDLVAATIARGLTGKLREVRHDSTVLDARFSPDGTRLVTAGYDKRARLWNVADGRLIAELAHADAVESARFLPDGSIVTASDDGTAVLWDGATGGKLATFDAKVGGGVREAVPSPDGQRIVTITEDDAIWVWDRDGRLVTRLGQAVPGKATSGLERRCAFSFDGARVAIGDRAGMLRIWATRSWQLLGSVRAHDGPINTVAFSSDGAHVVTASDDASAKVWSVAPLQLRTRVRHDAQVNAAAFSPDGNTIATASNDKSAKLWDASTGERKLSLDGHTAGVNWVEFSPDGTQIATVSDDAAVLLWRIDTGQRVSRLIGHRGLVSFVHYDAQGTRLVTSSLDGTAIVWSAAPQRYATLLRGHTDRVFAAELGPDDRTVASGGADGTARLWDRTSAKQLRNLPLDGSVVCCAAFSPDGALVATGNNAGVKLWDVATGRIVATLPSPDTNTIEWARDGSRFVSAHDDGVARLWTADGKPVASLNVGGGRGAFGGVLARWRSRAHVIRGSPHADLGRPHGQGARAVGGQGSAVRQRPARSGG